MSPANESMTWVGVSTLRRSLSSALPSGGSRFSTCSIQSLAGLCSPRSSVRALAALAGTLASTRAKFDCRFGCRSFSAVMAPNASFWVRAVASTGSTLLPDAVANSGAVGTCSVLARVSISARPAPSTPSGTISSTSSRSILPSCLAPLLPGRDASPVT